MSAGFADPRFAKDEVALITSALRVALQRGAEVEDIPNPQREGAVEEWTFCLRRASKFIFFAVPFDAHITNVGRRYGAPAQAMLDKALDP